MRLFWKRTSKAPPPPAGGTVSPGKRFMATLDRDAVAVSPPDAAMLEDLGLNQPQFDAYKSAVGAVADITSWRRQTSALGRTIGAQVEAILAAGGWKRALAGPAGRSAWANGHIHCAAMNAPMTIYARERHAEAYEAALAALEVAPGPDGKYRRVEQVYECAGASGASVTVVTGMISASSDIFEVLLVFPAAFKRAAHLTLDSNLLYAAFPRRFQTVPSPNHAVSASLSEGGRDHTKSWVQGLVVSDDQISRMKDWPNRPPPVYIGAGLVQVTM